MAHELRNLPSEAGLVRGLSRKGNCYDNAHMESRFHGLKTEMVYFEDFRSMEKGMRELRDALATTARLTSRQAWLQYQCPFFWVSPDCVVKSCSTLPRFWLSSPCLQRQERKICMEQALRDVNTISNNDVPLQKGGAVA